MGKPLRLGGRCSAALECMSCHNPHALAILSSAAVEGILPSRLSQAASYELGSSPPAWSTSQMCWGGGVLPRML
jgi:hypothetical protein